MKTPTNYVAILVVGAGAAAIALAPVAAAAPTGPSCVKLTRSATQCEPIGDAHHRSIRPETSRETQHPFDGSFGPFGVMRDHRDHR
ncbi:hypothetical protein MLIT_26750 [Mycolicibacterium litorale]|uniref:Uncharacterized protein n=2 Tax=Mycolicibacterium litorale TaxID=758802 RepID=A0AAD1MUH4_9MYCO|nr:hypothetical protein BCL50_1232 [Mycolicibacterium litorale]BBY17083.1 hypothetical protein MLIT_26750 [Mycolicibacterium litorale]